MQTVILLARNGTLGSQLRTRYFAIAVDAPIGMVARSRPAVSRVRHFVVTCCVCGSVAASRPCRAQEFGRQMPTVGLASRLPHRFNRASPFQDKKRRV